MTTLRDNMPIMPYDHWSRGGTGITNFGKEERPIYEEAIKRHGDPKITIHDAPLQVKNPPLNRCSLHREGGFRDLSEFWEVYRTVQKEFATADETH